MARTVATAETVDADALRRFIADRSHHILITHRSDGTPLASPVAGGVDDQGRIVISSYRERAKTANARRRPEASVLVLSEEWGGPCVQVDGTAEVIDARDDVEPLVDYFRALAGDHPDWDEYRQAMLDQDKSLIRITPTRWGPVNTGGFPAHLADE